MSPNATKLSPALAAKLGFGRILSLTTGTLAGYYGPLQLHWLEDNNKDTAIQIFSKTESISVSVVREIGNGALSLRVADLVAIIRDEG